MFTSLCKYMASAEMVMQIVNPMCMVLCRSGASEGLRKEVVHERMWEGELLEFARSANGEFLTVIETRYSGKQLLEDATGRDGPPGLEACGCQCRISILDLRGPSTLAVRAV